MRFRIALLFIVSIFVYSCTGEVKYPVYVKRAHPALKKQRVQARQVRGLKRGVVLLKRGRCREAIEFFHTCPSFRGRYCLMVAYGYCGYVGRAKRLFGKLEERSRSNLWEGRLYATMGFFLMLKGSSSYRDYLAVAYAYDSNNRLALDLMRRNIIGRHDRKLYFEKLFKWCSGN